MPKPEDVNAALEALGSTYRMPLSKEGTTWAEEERSMYGAKVPATLDTGRRPHVLNDDGSVSTVRSMGFTDEKGDQVLVPTVNVKGYVMSPDEAIDNYYRTGQHLGKYNSAAESDSAADALHSDHARSMPEDTLGGTGGRGMTVDDLNTERRHFNEPEMSQEEIDQGAIEAARQALAYHNKR